MRAAVDVRVLVLVAVGEAPVTVGVPVGVGVIPRQALRSTRLRNRVPLEEEPVAHMAVPVPSPAPTDHM